MSLEIDHVIVCVPDLGEAAQEFESERGVRSVEGGEHPGHGTANRLIPLGDSYIELLAVVNPAEAETSPLGSWAMRHSGAPGAHGLCLRTDDLAGVAMRLDVPPMAMSRLTPAGETLRWHTVALEPALASDLPFFIRWDIPDELHPGQIRVDHPAGEVRLSDVSMVGDVSLLRQWAPEPAGLTYESGEPAVHYRLAVL